MKASTYKVNGPLRLAAALACLIVMTTSLLAGLYARYTVSALSSDTARVAKFTISKELVDGSKKAVEHFNFGLTPVDEPVSYGIGVENDSETAVRYKLCVENLTGNLPLDIQLDGDPLDESGLSFDLEAGSTGRSHTLSFAWNSEAGTGENNFIYHREIDHLVLTLHCEQID